MRMGEATKARLEAGSARVTTVREFFGLTDEENELVETRVALAMLIQELREKRERHNAISRRRSERTSPACQELRRMARAFRSTG